MSVKIRNVDEYWILRTARTVHQCCNGGFYTVCVREIQPGAEYVYMEMPPGGEMGYLTWERAKVCTPCAQAFNGDAFGALMAAAGRA